MAKKLRSYHPALHLLEDRIVPDGARIDLGALTADPAAYAPARILVCFQSGEAPLGALPAGASLGSALALVPGLYEIELDSTLSVAAALAAFRVSSAVAYAEPDYLVHADLIPNDPSFGVLWGLNNTGQSGGTVDADIDAPEAWNISTGVTRVTVAVIDSGIDYNHPDLAANIWTNPGEIAGNGLDDDGNGYVDDLHGFDWVNNDGDPMDDNGHGTHVAGTIGAVGNNGVGVVGIDWNVRLMALKFLDAANNGFTSNAVKALNYAVTMGVGISNNSWGGASFDQSLYNAIANARSHGHLFVAAAGNGGANSDTTPFYPACYDFDNIVSVGATDRYDNLAYFSN
ncbi:MAG: S8 family serine peptidase, partial [Chloroflexota bacterium]